MNQTNATPIFAPLWRRKWLILAVGIVVGVLSYVYYKHKQPTYGATTQVYIGAGSEEQPVGEKASAKSPSTTSTNDVAIINSIVVEEVRELLRKQHRAAIAHSAKIKAKVPEKGQFITITAEASGAKRAAFLANATAQTFIKRQASTRRSKGQSGSTAVSYAGSKPRQLRLCPLHRKGKARSRAVTPPRSSRRQT
jgi:capsular polysaccharide biosynthesis protein